VAAAKHVLVTSREIHWTLALLVPLAWQGTQGPASHETAGRITPQEMQSHWPDPPQCQQVDSSSHSTGTFFGLAVLLHSARSISSISRSNSVFIRLTRARNPHF
jgi:hypothetical protein